MLLLEHVRYMCVSSEVFFELKKILSFKAMCEFWSPVLVLKHFKVKSDCDSAADTC